MYILPYKDEPSRLQNPPEKYSHIDKKQWESFVNARLSEEWEVTIFYLYILNSEYLLVILNSKVYVIQAFSRLQRERRAKCIYNHHISRKGYANLAQELVSYVN